MSSETLGWLATAVVMACGVAWRESDELRFFDLVATAGCLGLAGLTTHDDRLSVFSSRLTELTGGLVRTAFGIMSGFIPLVVRDFASVTLKQRWTQSLRGALRVALIVVPLTFVFGALLSGADPIFASFVSIPAIDFDKVLSHVLLTGFFAWLLTGWIRSAIVPSTGGTTASFKIPVRLGLLETTAALTTLNVLFAAYVLAQLGWLFGGEAFLRARTGLTAAEYARRGFFETVWVVFLVVPLLIGTRAALGGERRVLRRHTMLAVPVIALVGAIILSAIQRMRLYLQYYGLSADRLYALVFMTWLGVVLVWLALTILRGRDRLFAGGSIVSALFALAMLNVVSPDILVARVNIDRSTRSATPHQPLDVAYLAGLSGDAAPLTTQALLEAPVSSNSPDRADRCAAAKLLLERWGPSSRVHARLQKAAAWRWWNSGERSAIRVVERSAPALEAIAHDGCAQSPQASAQR